jgi:hypothetical protein
MWTAIPPVSSPRSSHSPVCTPARTRSPRSPTPPEAVRGALLALVEQDDPREIGQALEDAVEAGRLPGDLEVADEARHDHKVDRPLADRRVGEAHVSVLRETCVERSAHAHGLNSPGDG